jgi:hypothetical protein
MGHCVAVNPEPRASSRRERFAMQNFRAASVRLDLETFAEVERRAKKERRPIGNLLRIIVTDAINPPPAADGQDGRAA